MNSPDPPEVTVAVTVPVASAPDPDPDPAPYEQPSSPTTEYNVLHPPGKPSHPFSHPHDWNTVIGGFAHVQPAVTVLTVMHSTVMQVEQTLVVEMMMGHSETRPVGGRSVCPSDVIVATVVVVEGVGGRRGLVSGVVIMLVEVEAGRD